MYHVREAAEEERVAISAVMGAAFARVRQVYRPTQDAVERARSAPAEWLVATDDGKIIGVLRYRKEENRLHLAIGVLPANQRRGVGRALVEALAQRAQQRGMRTLSLYTVQETGNVPVFEAMGFVAIRS